MIKHILDDSGKYAKEVENDILAQAEGLESDYEEYSDKKKAMDKENRDDLKSREVQIQNKEKGQFFGLS